MLYKKLLALEQVERWNFHLHLRRQNVASHGHNVGIIAYIVASVLGESDASCEHFATEGLFHDFAEAVTGDIPTLVKRHIKDWDELEIRAEIEASQISPNKDLSEIVPFERPMSALVKLADALDAWLFARTEYNLGNGAFLPIRDELNMKVLEYTARVCDEREVPLARLLEHLGGLFAYDFPNASTKQLPEGMSHV